MEEHEREAGARWVSGAMTVGQGGGAVETMCSGSFQCKDVLGCCVGAIECCRLWRV